MRLSIFPTPPYSIYFRPGKPGLKYFFLALAALLAAQCGGRVYVVKSLASPAAVTVDGDANDWVGALSYVSSDHLFVGFINNQDDLYICLTKEENRERPGASMGALTVWFDPAGGSQKKMGIRLAGGPPTDSRMERGPERKPEEKPEEPPDRGGGERPPGPAADLEILGPKGDVLGRKSLEAAAEEGIEVKTGYSGGSFVLEIRIPLKRSNEHPFAVGAGPEGIVGVGFASSRSADRKRQGRPPGGGGQPPGGGGPGGMGGGIGGGAMGGVRGGGMGGGMRPNMDPDIPKTFKVWTRVKLSSSAEPRRSSLLDIVS